MSSCTTPFAWLSPIRRPAGSRDGIAQPPAAPLIGERPARDRLFTAASETPPVGRWCRANFHAAAITLLTAGRGPASHNKWGPG
jgi:hypothetical protein